MRYLILILMCVSGQAWSQIPAPNWQQQPQKIMIEAICLPSMEMIGRLNSLGEQPMLSADMTEAKGTPGLIVMWTDPATSNWTLTATFTGTTCILSAGKGFRESARKPGI
jgi:hypothetical protein